MSSTFLWYCLLSCTRWFQLLSIMYSCTCTCVPKCDQTTTRKLQHFLNILTVDTPTSGLLWRGRSINNCPSYSVDVFIDNSNPAFLITSVFRKSSYTGLLTNFYSFVPLSYKLGLVCTLVDRAFKINNTWFGFHDNIKELTNILGKNMFP